MIEPRPSVSVSRTVKKVATARGVQHHHGYAAWVRIPGQREPVRCCAFHQKPKAAREHGEKVARALMRERSA